MTELCPPIVSFTGLNPSSEIDTMVMFPQVSPKRHLKKDGEEDSNRVILDILKVLRSIVWIC